MANTVEETKIKEEEEKVKEQVDEAGKKAKQDAEAKGASPEEVKETVEKARKEEKDKLYPQIEELKNSFKDIQKVLQEEREEKEQIKKDAAKLADEERRAKLSDQERTNEILQRLEEQLKEERKERERLKRDLEKRRDQDQLEAHRTVLIERNKDEIIPELVQGSTVKELDDSLEVAKARFKELAERFRQERADGVRGGMPGPTNPDLEALEELEISKDLTAIDQDKYLEDPDYRKRIQAELENEYARLSGRR